MGVIREGDHWADWVLHHRYGNNPAYEEIVREEIIQIVDRVLDQIPVPPNACLLDLGSGDGVLPFRAYQRFGTDISITFSDISPDLISVAKTRAEQFGVANQSRFLVTSAGDLSEIKSNSLDVVTSRATLAYVPDYSLAVTEAYRVLKLGGWFTVAEPVFDDECLGAQKLLGYAAANRGNTLAAAFAKWKAAQFLSESSQPLFRLNERGLYSAVQNAGFAEVHAELHMSHRPVHYPDWRAFLTTSPHPLAPTLQAIMDQQLSPEEVLALSSQLKPAFDAGSATATDRIVYLRAKKTQ